MSLDQNFRRVTQKNMDNLPVRPKPEHFYFFIFLLLPHDRASFCGVFPHQSNRPSDHFLNVGWCDGDGEDYDAMEVTGPFQGETT